VVEVVVAEIVEVHSNERLVLVVLGVFKRKIQILNPNSLKGYKII
jgi:hypothetical protein